MHERASLEDLSAMQYARVEHACSWSVATQLLKVATDMSVGMLVHIPTSVQGTMPSTVCLPGFMGFVATMVYRNYAHPDCAC